MMFSFGRTLAALAVAVVLIAWRMWVALPQRLKGKSAAPKKVADVTPRTTAAKTLVVLGSGGHTSEMMSLLRGLVLREGAKGQEGEQKGLDTTRYAPLVFVLSATDKTSLPQMRARGMAAVLGDDSAGEGASAAKGVAKIIRITRAREVGQGWLSSFLTSARACLEALSLVRQERPALLLVNGPGVCLPVCLAAFVLRLLASPWYHPKIIFCESFCRVRSLSVTGRVMYHLLADRFVVHWPALQKRFPRSEYLGTIY